jgi:hypothetical protein
VFTVIRLTKEEPGSVPAASPRLPRSSSSWPPGQPPKTSQRVPRPTTSGRVRAAPGPYPPDLSRSKFEGRKRRFLAYSFPSRSPGPSHLAVLTRPGFVRGRLPPSPAPPGSGCPQLHLPGATGQAVKVSHLHSNQQRLTAQDGVTTRRLRATPC